MNGLYYHNYYASFFRCLISGFLYHNNNSFHNLNRLSSISSGLQFVLAPGGSPLSELFIPKEALLDEYEICPEAAVITEHMSKTIEKNGGSSLIIDYGKDGPSQNTLRVSNSENNKLLAVALGL